MRIVSRLLRGLNARLQRLNNFGPGVNIHPDAWVSGSTLRGDIIISQGCKLHHAELEGRVTVSRYTSLWGPGLAVMGREHGVSIGGFCSIARFVSIQEDNHEVQRTTTYFVERNLFDPPEPVHLYSRGPIEIGSDVWIGAGAQVHSGVKIGHGAVVAGAAVVTRDVPPYAVVAGNPARLIRLRFNADTVRRLLADAWWDWPLDRLREEREYLLALHDRPL